LGNLSVRRDFGFAGDYVEAMHALLQQGIADDYVIGTGRAYTIQQFCEVAFRTVGLDWQNHVDIDPELFRKSDSRNTLANITKLRSAVDWRPGTSFEELVSLMVSAQIDRFNGKSSYDLDVMDVERPAQTDRLASEHSDFE
jgi:GDPmannose 4,6-dehydratase